MPQSHENSFACRSCSGSKLVPVISLGSTPLANGLLDHGSLHLPETTWPLDLVRCANCSLVQITETVPPEVLFRDYAYFSSFSDTMVEHARQLTQRLTNRFALNAESLVVEVASNDGYLLQWYHQQGIPVLGIEPAENIAQVANEKGIRTRPDFFGSETAGKLHEEGFAADVIHANNVLAHVADLNGVVSGFAKLLASDGTAVVEAPYLKTMIDDGEFDTIYHEHLCYFSLTALDHLFSQHGLRIVDVEKIEIHGGSIRIYAVHEGSQEVSPAVNYMLAEEQAWVFSESYFQQFNDRVMAIREDLTSFLAAQKAAGKRIAVYGASAKGSTLLNVFGIDSKTLDYVVDRSTVKQGKYTPGSRLKIVAPEHLASDQPDFCLLLTWNFADEILSQQQTYRDNGGKFIIPIPHVRVA